MKLTIVLVALIALGLSENSGGKKDEDINDPKFKQMIEEIESFSDPNDYQIKTVESEEMKESDKEVTRINFYFQLIMGESFQDSSEFRILRLTFQRIRPGN